MEEFEVVIARTISTNVKVVAESAKAAAEQVNRADFPLPPREEWDGRKDWYTEVYNGNGDIVYEVER